VLATVKKGVVLIKTKNVMINNKDLFGNNIKKTLKEKYILPPYSVIDLNKTEYKNRAKRYIKMGIKSEIGRSSAVYTASSSKDTNKIYELEKGWSDGAKKYRERLVGKNKGVSVFNPFVCEVLYNWFCPENGTILDPFAGGSVRGIMANYLGYKYTGIELRKEQVESNREQGLDVLDVNNQPQWYVGDSEKVTQELQAEYDFIFSCPPYANLEVYSDLDDDISNMEYPLFLEKYSKIIKNSCEKLKDGCFAVFVVSEVRKKGKGGYFGGYIGFVSDTINCFKDAGMDYYNEIIMINNTGNAGLRADKYMRTKKVVRVHQNILVFKKS